MENLWTSCQSKKDKPPSRARLYPRAPAFAAVCLVRPAGRRGGTAPRKAHSGARPAPRWPRSPALSEPGRVGREGRGKQRVSHSDAGQARGHRAGRGWDGTAAVASCPPAGLGDSPRLPSWSLREPGLRACAVGGPGPHATGAAPRGARPQRALDPRLPQLRLSRRPGPTSRMGTRWQKPIFPPS